MLLKKLDKLEEEDFVIFRIPFETGRQSLSNIKRGLLLGVFVQFLFGGVFIYVVADPEVYPNEIKTILIGLSYLITTCLIIISIIFTLPNMYKKRQHIQYLIFSLMLLNVSGLSLYLMSMLFLNRGAIMDHSTYIILICITFLLLFLFFVLITLRLISSLEKGFYRRESRKFDYEDKYKEDTKRLTKLPEVTVGIVGLIIIMNSLFKYSNLAIELLIATILCFLLPYISVYMFAHSLITYYCKKRFTSFNFDEDGNLYPLGSGDRVRDKELA